MTLYENIIGLLKRYGIYYKEYNHGPILNYEDADREMKIHNWVGIESKNVFLKGKNGKYYVFVTTAGKKVDFKELKELLGVKCSIASEENVKDVIDCVPGCVAPFGFSPDVVIVLDSSVFENNDYLFSPGVTTKTIQVNIKDLRVVFDDLPNEVIILD